MATQDAHAHANTGWFPRLRGRFGHPFALLLLVLCCTFVIAAWHNARERELRLAEAQFQSNIGKLAGLVQLRLTSCELTLRGGVSLFAALQWPSSRHWHNYVDSVSLQTRFPSLVGLGFSAHVDDAGLASLQALLVDVGNGRLDMHPAGERGQYGPVVYIEPATDANRQTVGFDMYSEPVRQAAMRRAMESGQPTLSGVVTLEQSGLAGQPGMLMYSPVYDSVVPPESPALRRQLLKGWVFAPFLVRPMLEGALAPARSAERMRVVDVSGDAQVVLYEDPDIGPVNAFTHSLPMTFYGRRWRLDFFSGPERVAAPRVAALRNLLLAGLLGSLLLFGLTWLLASTEARANRLAAEMTDSYRRSEQRFRSALEYSAIGNALLDGDGRIIAGNPAFAAIVGRKPEALEGMLLADLLDHDPHPLRSAQRDALVVHAQDGAVRASRTLHREDGELRHVQLTFSQVPGDPGRDIGRLVQMEDITARVRAEEAVLSLNRTLEARVASRTRELSEANRELESFAYSVSHDLRAPLRAIEGFSRILGERYAAVLDDTGRDYLERVRKATSRMAELIDALLKLSRIGRADLRMEQADLTALAEDVAAGLGDAEPGRRVEIVVQPGMRARGDVALLRVLLENLMGNAWKFTRGQPAPRIEVGSEPDAQGTQVFHVRDNGAGFDPDYADKLFRPFQRLHSQDAFPGHGIGLASVKRILERHGGSIDAEGEPGRGAVFRFTLPDGGP